jgi:hypothetical protein
MSPQANTPGTPVLHSASTLMVSSISGMTPRSMAMSAADLAPSSMKTPSVGMTVPSTSVMDSTLSVPSMDTGLLVYILTPASNALDTTDWSAVRSQATHDVSDAYDVIIAADDAASDSFPTITVLRPL